MTAIMSLKRALLTITSSIILKLITKCYITNNQEVVLLAKWDLAQTKLMAPTSIIKEMMMASNNCLMD